MNRPEFETQDDLGASTFFRHRPGKGKSQWSAAWRFPPRLWEGRGTIQRYVCCYGEVPCFGSLCAHSHILSTIYYILHTIYYVLCTYLHTYILTYILTYLHTCILTYLHTYILTCLHTYILKCLYTLYLYKYILLYLYTIYFILRWFEHTSGAYLKLP